MTRLADENAETRRLIEKAQGGDGQALEQLLAKFLPLRKALATYWGERTPKNSKGIEWDDLIQQIALLFIEEVYRFDPAKSPDPVLHLSVALRRSVARWCVQEGYGRLREVGGEEIEELMDIPVERGESGELLVAGLTSGQAKVVAALAKAGTQEAAAAILGVTNQAVSKRLKVIRKKLARDNG